MFYFWYNSLMLVSQQVLKELFFTNSFPSKMIPEHVL